MAFITSTAIRFFITDIERSNFCDYLVNYLLQPFISIFSQRERKADIYSSVLCIPNTTSNHFPMG